MLADKFLLKKLFFLVQDSLFINQDDLGPRGDRVFRHIGILGIARSLKRKDLLFGFFWLHG